ncbi:hypothetical protein D4R89_00510 [bacterium]|nr:MAG: hypothetical protein D4R89_00510 [bacterium]
MALYSLMKVPQDLNESHPVRRVLIDKGIGADKISPDRGVPLVPFFFSFQELSEFTRPLDPARFGGGDAGVPATRR